MRVRAAHSEADRRLCADLLAQHHPLGPGGAPGCRLSHLLEAAWGPLGVLSFVAAPFRLGPRDAFLGWDERTRGAHIERVARATVSARGERAGRQPGLARAGPSVAEAGPGLAAGTRRAALAGGDLRAEFAAELPSGRLAVRGQTQLQPPQRRLGQYLELVLEEEASWARREFGTPTAIDLYGCCNECTDYGTYSRWSNLRRP